MSLVQGSAEARRALLGLGGASAHDRIGRTYGVDFYITLVEGGSDFSLFFRYVGEKTAQAKNLHTRDLRGTVRVTEWNT